MLRRPPSSVWRGKDSLPASLVIVSHSGKTLTSQSNTHDFADAPRSRGDSKKFFFTALAAPPRGGGSCGTQKAQKISVSKNLNWKVQTNFSDVRI